MDVTFKQRVNQFWLWFEGVAPRFYAEIEAGNCSDLVDEVGQFMGQTMPELAWAFGPGDGGGHSFTVSGEGVVPKQLLAEYWHSHQSQCEGWTFFPSRQPNHDVDGISLAIDGVGQIDANDMLVQTVVDEEAMVFDIVIWHPLFEQFNHELQVQFSFLLLDEVLGEYGTQGWVGGLEMKPLDEQQIDGKRVHRLKDLPKFIDGVQRYHQWNKLPPPESFTAYAIESEVQGPRGDTIAGVTCVPGLLFELMEEGGRLSEDPMAGTGAELAYVQIDSEAFPADQQPEARYNLEEQIQEALDDANCGRILGGATGTEFNYIDLLLFDGEASRSVVESVLTGVNLSGRYRWSQFA
ncbi:hypothetical protein SV7mr_12170 [Stieleria bergensis]|uniref:Uncharacterized protein n=1 Tax=Stieleria bergensis TaxID=2528025 RepID=A0A517SRH6_9BACT|nr:hypothetical protein SV7mr_12170 [Planctomycetes bacterium SV_7m_r]